MAPIFASQDIAEIVAAFPPPPPAKDSNSLVRSRSGERLVDAQNVLHKLHQLLDGSRERISINHLASTLGIDESDWILECYDGDLSFSKDKLYLIPNTELRQILDELSQAAESEFVDLSAWASRNDVWLPSLDQAQHKSSSNGGEWTLKSLIVAGDRKFLYRPAFYENVKREVRAAIEVSSPDLCNLSSRFSKVPNAVLSIVAQDLISAGSCKGSIQVSSDALSFVPDDFEASRRRKADEASELRVNEILAQVHDNGSVRFQKDAASDGIRENLEMRLQDPYTRTKVVIINLDGGSWSVASQDAVDKAIQALTDNAKKQMTLQWKQNKNEMPTNLSDERILSGLPEKQGLVADLLRSGLRKAVQTSIALTVSDLMAADRNAFVLATQERIMAPFQLYSKGVETIPDDTTRERLDSYVAQYIRTDIIEAAIQSLRSDNLLRDKTRSKDVEKFSTAMSACQSLADVASAVAKVSRKQKLEEPTLASLRQIKLQILQSKVKGLKKLARGSDILQNATWILLAQAMHAKDIDALFISSGKDTTRMIKAYQALGVAENEQKLARLRDTLKAGQESKEDVDEIKEVAETAVRDMVDAAN